MAGMSERSGYSEDRKPVRPNDFGAPTMLPGGRVPLQERVPSTSQVPAQLGLQPPMAREASPRYEYQFFAIIESQQGLIDSQRRTMEAQRQEIDCQRQLIDDEKALWQKKEADLIERIAQLEARLHQVSHCGSATSQPEGSTSEQKAGLWTPSTSNDGSGTVSRQSSTGEAPVWNPRPAQQPTRVFSEAFAGESRDSRGALNSSRHNTNVDENIKNNDQISPGSEFDVPGSLLSQRLRQKSSIPGHLISKDYDGIMFKPPRSSTSESEPVVTVQPDDPNSQRAYSPRSPPQISPKAQRPFRNVLIPKDVDPTLKDAGHTPMARGSLSMLTSMDGSASTDDSGSTPKAELERPSLEPHMSKQEIPKQPSERQESYFGSFVAPADIAADKRDVEPRVETPEQDQALEGPLGLTNTPDSERNKIFLGELNRKLSNVNLREPTDYSESPTISPPPAAPSQPDSSDLEKDLQNVDGSPCEVPEPEPPLRIKKSMNFGSALGQGGEVDYGKGFSRREL